MMGLDKNGRERGGGGHSSRAALRAIRMHINIPETSMMDSSSSSTTSISVNSYSTTPSRRTHPQNLLYRLATCQFAQRLEILDISRSILTPGTSTAHLQSRTPFPCLRALSIHCDDLRGSLRELLKPLGQAEAPSIPWCFPSLVTLDISFCPQLTSLDGLVSGGKHDSKQKQKEEEEEEEEVEQKQQEGIQRGQERSGGGGDRSSTKDKETGGGFLCCRYLWEIDASYTAITSLDGLRPPPPPSGPDSSSTSVVSVLSPLSLRRTPSSPVPVYFPALCRLQFDCCEQLSCLDGLAEGFEEQLEELTVTWAPITSIAVLKHCRGLRTVNLHGCMSLSTLEGLENHMRLEEVEICQTSVTSVAPLLQGCPAFCRLIVEDLQQLADRPDEDYPLAWLVGR